MTDQQISERVSDVPRLTTADVRRIHASAEELRRAGMRPPAFAAFNLVLLAEDLIDERKARASLQAALENARQLLRAARLIAQTSEGEPMQLRAVIDEDDPKQSRFEVNGQDIGAKQIELRVGKVSNNEVVCRIPIELVTVTFVKD